MSDGYKTACDHDLGQFVHGDEGTAYCPACEAEGRQAMATWLLVERYCERYPSDWRLVFKRGGEVLEVSVPEDVWRAFDAALGEADERRRPGISEAELMGDQ